MSAKQIPMQGLTLLLVFVLVCVAHGQNNTENVYLELPPGFEEGFKDGTNFFYSGMGAEGRIS